MAKGTVSDSRSVKSILVYTFYSRWKKCSKWLYEASQSNIYPISTLFVQRRFSTNNLLVSLADYQYVIGIADHSKVALNSRFDKVYVNKYGRSVLSPDAEEMYQSNLDLLLPSDFRIFTKSTNGPCNRSAYLCMKKIKEENLSTKFGFFHCSPKRIDEDITKLLQTIQCKLETCN